MQRKDKVVLIGVGIITGLISLIVANALFSSPTKHDSMGPVVEKIPSSLPDVKNDSNYNSFINSNALDPTQPVQIGNTQNKNPF